MTDYNKCSKCMYSAMFVIASANNENPPTVCKQCCNESTDVIYAQDLDSTILYPQTSHVSMPNTAQRALAI